MPREALSAPRINGLTSVPFVSSKLTTAASIQDPRHEQVGAENEQARGVLRRRAVHTALTQGLEPRGLEGKSGHTGCSGTVEEQRGLFGWLLGGATEEVAIKVSLTARGVQMCERGGEGL